MNYKTGYCFSSVELFDNFDVTSVKMPSRYAQKYRNKDSKKEMFGEMLTYLLYLIVLDIIENNVTFVLPLLGNREGCFYVKSFTDESFKKMYRNGMFMGIDFLSSGFTGYQIYFQYTPGNGLREKPIYINNNIKEIFYENINNGMKYY